MERDEVALGNELVERNVARAELALVFGEGAIALCIENTHAESLGPTRHGAADATEADDAERRASDTRAEKLRRCPASPGSGTGKLVGFDDAPRRGEQERHAEIGGGVGEHAGGVGDEDAATATGIEIDVVHADGIVRDDAEIGSRLEERLVDAIAEERDEGVFSGNPREDALTSEPGRVLSDFDVMRGAEAIEGIAGELCGDEDASHGGAFGHVGDVHVKARVDDTDSLSEEILSSSEPDMRAIVIREPGGFEVLELRELPDPQILPGHVRVRITHAGVNRADLLQRMGRYPAPPGVPSDVPGLEYSGYVEAVGAGVTRFTEGARVLGLTAGGAYAEKIVVHEREAVAVPDALTDEQAGAIAEVFVTAYDALVTQAKLSPGEAVLIHAAGSGVGTAAVQIARALGCTVIGTSRKADKLERARSLGLDHGIVPEGGTFAREVKERTGGRGVDVVLDLVGGDYFPEELLCCAPRARVIVVGLTAGRTASIDLGLLLRQRVQVTGTVLRARPLEEKILAAQILERHLLPLFTQGRLSPVIERTFPIEEAGKAHELVASDTTFGKVLLRI